MTIAIDLRSIQRGTFTGVENYTLSVLERMIGEDKQNKYVLFYNGLAPIQAEDLRFLNTSVVVGRMPNKLLALTTTFAKRPDFSELIGSKFDCLFMPNMNHVVLGPHKRLVVTVHDLSPVVLPEYYDVRRRMWHWSVGFQRTLQRADAIIAVSEFTKQQLVDVLGLPESKITVVYQGIDSKRFHPDLSETHLRDVRNRYGVPGEYIFYCGTLEPRKNVERLIGAWERMEHRIPLVIAGKPGWKYRSIFNRAKRSVRGRQIQFLGFVAEADKPALYKLAAVTSFPSLYEGFGLPVLESMAVGTPVVTSQVTSLPEVCGSAGVLVDPYNETSIAAGLDAVVGDRALRAALAAEGLIRAKQFSWDNTAEQTLAVLTAGKKPDTNKLGIFE